MKKISSYVKSGGNQVFHEQVKSFYIYENFSYKEQCKSYIQSFMKQRMLMIWKSQRALLQIAPMFPEPLESNIYKNVYERIKPLLVGAYHEDFHRSDSEFTFQSWLANLQETAHKLHRPMDALYWNEIVSFIEKNADQSYSRLDDSHT